jgi:hypothetical protein
VGGKVSIDVQNADFLAHSSQLYFFCIPLYCPLPNKFIMNGGTWFNKKSEGVKKPAQLMYNPSYTRQIRISIWLYGFVGFSEALWILMINYRSITQKCLMVHMNALTGLY